MERQQAEHVLSQTLAFRQSDHLELSLHGGTETNTRFANNTITQNTVQRNVTLHVSAAFGQKVGHASTNRLDSDSLQEVVGRAEQIATHTELDTEYLPPVDPSEYIEIPAYDEITARVSPQMRAEAVKDAIEFCERQKLQLAGHFATGYQFDAIANSQGMIGFHRRSTANYTNTVITSSSSGWAESVGETLDQIDPKETVEIACQKALTGQLPKEIPPGKYTVVMAPSAVAGLLSYLFYSMDAKAADEGRSAFSEREGRKIGTDQVQIYSQPQHPACPASPFFNNGIPTADVYWIRQGILENLAYSRYWAQHTGHAYTGSPTNFIMDGTDVSLNALIASVDQGLLITRFWYIRFVDPMKLLLTGMTRDGLFWIKNGAIQYGVKNLRFNESPLNVINNIEMFGKSKRVHGSSYVPSLKVRDFTFTSGTSF
ncbi:TPA: TldD/PmbA family protein [Candidatus Poribacteria bacterium]|jgi:predicted Zn-dependent protease|nr:TldD/PmbA family protein [Candidatus Poribacteria bacterium]HIA64609.1 TldD/PmbA family protein [Candidatus Poribacteria bacterium]HIB87726.1 TldD/PmbA family protein [Candidatus Poribacteria bacterium]HIC03463.1 TldD/PmbA family protein [Candidatus Poribacteria bacterium]HIC17337.1 TldD/PmbA family protein [Candidatus Poribacteria bacterium]